MAIGPYPEFSWSHSRDGTFQRCERQYYFQYYGKWMGWQRNAPARVQTTYLLTQLTGLSAWAGSAVHEAIALFLHTGPHVDQWREQTRHRMRQQYRNSNNRIFKQPGRAKSFGLEEHYYDVPLSDDSVRGAWEKVDACLDAFLQSPWRQRIAEAQRAGRFVYIEPPTSDFNEMRINDHPLGPFPIYAQPDVVFEDEKGQLYLLDWKTGRPPTDRGADEIPPQLAFYLLWLQTKGGTASHWPYDKVTLAEIYLPSLALYGATPTEATWDAAHERARDSITIMQNKLNDKSRNIAEEQSFSLTENQNLCQHCVFRGVCPSEAAIQAFPDGVRP
ncbi:MAG: hypothetical protein CMH56_13210 [Myxococcales bacterium]|mgnify:CR=1 FL=1|nr:hypothetical protein [Myxococcales bacterium]|tara:strand:- start:897 stop:1889 length:993 start_codon:yes stop_codon:yes gene_type:complete